MTQPHRILVLEPRAEGHHAVYADWIVRGLAGRGHDVAIVTSQTSARHPVMSALLADRGLQGVVGSGALPDAGTRLGGFVRRELMYWRLLRRWAIEMQPRFRPSVILVPFADYCLHAVGLIGSPFAGLPWVGIAMRPSFHYSEVGLAAPRPMFSGIKRRLLMRALRQKGLKSLLFTDELLVQYLAGQPAAGTRFGHLAEPFDPPPRIDRASARLELQVKAGRKLLLVFGAISERKGVSQLLQALKSPEFPSEIDVMLAGRLDAAVAKVLSSDETLLQLQSDERLRIMNKFLSGGEEHAAFSAADMVWLGYQGHFVSSGVLVQAAKYAIPTMACDQGVIGWQTGRHGLGLTVRVDSQEDIIRAATALSRDDELYRRLSDSASRAFTDNNLVTAIDTLVECL